MPEAAELERIAAVLGQRLPGGHRIGAVRAISDGFSNRTFLVEGADLILRLPPTGEPLLAAFGVHDVAAQYRIMEEFSRLDHAPPVPRPILLEPDKRLLGFPFFVMERVACDHWGDFSRPEWLNNAAPAFRSGVSEHLVHTYVRLHGLAPMASLGAPRSARDELERWHGPVRGRIAPDLAEAFAILFDNVPDDQAPAPCHGDAKVANLLWKNGRVAALVDYEMAFNGDPRWDLAALLQGMRSADGQHPLPLEDETGFWGQNRIVSEWQKGTGRSIARLGWFRAADRARYASLLVHGQWLWQQGKTADARLGSLGAVARRLAETALSLARHEAIARA